ncbi:MAG: tRNA 2-thiouridine(34) synthase MnmA, partial [Clostridia bacterium]|nr:tRNA 2-thiouridine(34) synthase MnmA [Clostridia bacterium]
KLKKALCLPNDQSYFLFGLNQSIMEKVIFPLGGVDSKETVRELARSEMLENSEERDSQDICFVPDGNYIEIIEKYYAEKGKTRRPGSFVDTEGNVIGTHGGMERFTIGQRKGVGMTLGGEPMYVIAKRAEDGAVIMGRDELLYTDTLTVIDPNFPWLKKGETPPSAHGGLQLKTRSGQKTVPASLEYDSVNNVVTARVEKPLRAAAPGQFAVFYEGDEVYCGGEIQ